jgi:hypothetical protein
LVSAGEGKQGRRGGGGAAISEEEGKRRGGAAQHRRHIGQEAVARGMKKQETDAYMATLHFQRI